MPRHLVSSPINTVNYSTRELRVNEQFDYWCHLSRIDVLRPRDDIGKVFFGEGKVYHLGSILIDRFQSDAKQFERTRDHIRRSSLDHHTIHLVHSGRVDFAAADRSISIVPGNLGFSSMAQPARGQTDLCDRSVLFVPRDFVPGISGKLDALALTGISGEFFDFLYLYLENLIRLLPRVEQAAVPALAKATRNMLEACVSATQESIFEVQEVFAALFLQRARRYIDANLKRQVTPDELSRHLGISRARLYRLFDTGGGVASYIRQRRLAACHDALAQGDNYGLIKKLWSDYGFACGASFSRAFKREFGYAPSEAWLRNRKGEVVIGVNEIDPLSVWLRALGG